MLTHKDKIKAAKILKIIAAESYCENLKVGALLLNSKSYIVGEGRNGTISGFPNVCEDANGVTLPTVIHAELNAILHYTGHEKNLRLVCSYSPCTNCAKHIVASGIISEVYYLEEYIKDVEIPRDIFKLGGIHYERLEI
jgi:dCMP deaminase